jgi:hypothetical protein
VLVSLQFLLSINPFYLSLLHTYLKGIVKCLLFKKELL